MKAAARELADLPEQSQLTFPFEARKILARTPNAEAVVRTVLADDSNPRGRTLCSELYLLLVYPEPAGVHSRTTNRSACGPANSSRA